MMACVLEGPIPLTASSVVRLAVLMLAQTPLFVVCSPCEPSPKMAVSEGPDIELSNEFAVRQF